MSQRKGEGGDKGMLGTKCSNPKPTSKTVTEGFCIVSIVTQQNGSRDLLLSRAEEKNSLRQCGCSKLSTNVDKEKKNTNSSEGRSLELLVILEFECLTVKLRMLSGRTK